MIGRWVGLSHENSPMLIWAGLPGPWVSAEKFQLIERFKFFHELAWKRISRGKKLLQQLARYRCDRHDYRWPVEMLLTRWVLPAQRLS